MGLLDYLDTSRRQLGLLGDAEFPVGDIPLFGGYVLNDALRPFTDSRGDGNMLPPSTTLNKVGRGMEALAPANVVKGHAEAIAGQTTEGEPVEGLARLAGLFPAAGAEGGGLLSPAVERGSTTLGTYAGRRARTADTQALQKAQRMARKGGDASPGGEIQQKTGWFRNAGDEWQFEISDEGASLKPHPTDPDQVVLDHPDLTAAYPEVGQMPIHLLRPDAEMKGWYGRGGMSPDTGEAGIRRDLPPEEQLSVALHELGGHAVQDIEGFSGGSSPRANVALSQQLTQSIFEEAKQKWQSGRMTADEALDWARDQTQGLSSYDLYQRQLGEYAARDIQARMNLTAAERRQIPPYSSEDHNPADLLTTLNPPFKPGRRPRNTALSTGAADIPTGASAAIPPHPLIGQVFPDQFKASAAVMAAGGRNSGLKVTIQPDKTAIIEAASASPVPAAPSGNPALAAPVVRPGPVSPQSSVDRRGLPGRPSLRPQSDILHTDPEGRPLYQGSLIAGQRTAGGADTPLTMLEEHQLAGLLGDFNPNARTIGDNGVVTSLAPGMMDPPAPPRLKIEVDPSGPHVDMTTRHEGGHALDYWTERTQRGANTQQQYAIPDDVRGELEQASATMRPDLWAPNVDQIYQRSKDVMERYRTRPDELMADGYRYYKENPAEFKAKYPNAAAYIRSQVNDDPLLSRHVQFNVKGGSGGLLSAGLGRSETAPLYDDQRKR
jgi:hypothetical protein